MTPTLAVLAGFVVLLLDILKWTVIVQAILSWLVAFNVVNTQNRFVREVLRVLDRLLEPLYRPIRRILPDFGGIDLSPMVVLLVILLIQKLIVVNVPNYL
ncbi:YggT family protein [Glacieibacterium frigidum]|uniref:YggT family protein n=1 Tax=Glacieibacterium frigidum TaxID=2593303 RepID=A0A552U9U0_9SPHN|nr:YggT family protein [Glacieibacterium frigidum]TRW14975.1 YggT family protein [Glacieibacterium frigidum]